MTPTRSNRPAAAGGMMGSAVLVLFVCVSCSQETPPAGSAWRPVAQSRIAPPASQPGFAETWDHRAFSHQLWDAVARVSVTEPGGVDYGRIGEDARFQEYLYRLSRTDPAGLPDDRARLAFWINAYNVLTLQGVRATLAVDKARWPNYRINGVKIDGKSFWRGLEFQVGGQWYTLDGIEHGLLRRTAGLQDPRMHLVLVCAAKGCPPLWNRAYTAPGIDQELTEAVRRFVADQGRCQFDRRRRIIRTAKIFDWYGKDFTSPDFSPRAESVPKFLARYVADEALAQSLANDDWTVEFVQYDWSLNLKQP